jgi:2-polyprenyl-3-methyl-5-hydroxy-6-metoxy-1,4-benzoquinol methylase
MLTCKCAICGASANLLFKKHLAYMAPSTFDIYDCANCETRFAMPMVVDANVYDLIYAHSDEIPGYERYERYRRALKNAPDPLGYLAAQEDVYWSIKEALQYCGAPQVEKVRILEIGSGLGYLTYALKKTGYDCFGIDVSLRAVEAARRDFGDLFFHMDIMEMPIDDRGTFDFVIATELIEHIVDPKKVLGKAKKLLRPGGRLILTTPNKDLYSDCFVWHTDLPPVHLWWFSKNSMRTLAWSLGMTVRFVDFSEFYGWRLQRSLGQTKVQTLDESGRVVFHDSLFNKFMHCLLRNVSGVYKVAANIYIRMRIFGKVREVKRCDSLSFCVVMQKSDVEMFNG